jgi:hypothetical protein
MEKSLDDNDHAVMIIISAYCNIEALLLIIDVCDTFTVVKNTLYLCFICLYRSGSFYSL